MIAFENWRRQRAAAKELFRKRFQWRVGPRPGAAQPKVGLQPTPVPARVRVSGHGEGRNPVSEEEQPGDL